MDLKSKLDSFFKRYKNEISINELVSKFKANENETMEILKCMYQLEKEGKIYCNENNKYIHVSKDFYLYNGTISKSIKNNHYINLKKGKIIIIPDKNLNNAKQGDIVFVEVKKSEVNKKQIIGNVVRIVKEPKLDEFKTFYKAVIKKDFSKDIYYANIQDKNFYIPLKDLCGAYPNDLVTIQVINNKYAKVVQVIKRAQEFHVLQYRKINDKLVWTPIGTIPFSINVDFNKENIDFKENDRILVQLSIDNEAKYIKQINNDNTFKSYVQALFCDEGFVIDFSKEAMKEIENLPKTIEKSERAKRKDYTNLTTITIDGSNAKDLDDAISLQIKDNKYVLYVHIADVSHYIKPGMHLFEEAYIRGTSVYPSNYVFPMLPEEISNNLCSLNPNEEKLAITHKLEFDLQGNLLDFSIYRSIIKSNYKMTYDKVNDVLDNNIIDEDYTQYVDLLKGLNSLSQNLQKKKLERGFIFFETNEVEYNINETGDVKEIINCDRGPAQLIVENSMLVTNETVSYFAYCLQIPFGYRNHEGPSVDQMNNLKNTFKEFEKYLITMKNAKNPKVLQKILLSIFKKNNYFESVYVSKQVLSYMNRAYYDNECLGHYALSLDVYGTFTSPIRRFIDLANHVMIGNVLDGNIDKIDFEKKSEEYKRICQHCTQRQLASENFEKMISNLLLSNYLKNYEGEVLESEIIFMNNDYICVKTKNNLYGNIPIKRSMFKNKSVTINGRTYTTGDIINVIVDIEKDNAGEVSFIPASTKNKVLMKK